MSTIFSNNVRYPLTMEATIRCIMLYCIALHYDAWHCVTLCLMTIPGGSSSSLFFDDTTRAGSPHALLYVRTRTYVRTGRFSPLTPRPRPFHANALLRFFFVARYIYFSSVFLTFSLSFVACFCHVTKSHC